jgi:hypothetical protein
VLSTVWYGAGRTPKTNLEGRRPAGPSDAYPIAPIYDRHRELPLG